MPKLLFSSPRSRRVLQNCALAVLLGLTANSASGREKLELRHQAIELPGPPAAIVAADVNQDGLQDLVVVVVYTVWDEIGIEETTEMDQVEGLVEVLTIVPALLDHRELFVFLGTENGSYRSAGRPLPLDSSVLSIEAGPTAAPIVVLTDTGISLLRPADFEGAEPQSQTALDDPVDQGPESEDSGAPNQPTPFVLQPHIASRPVLAGTSAFIPRLGLMRDLNGDGELDLLFPAPHAFEIYLTTEDGLASTPSSRWSLPSDPTDASPRQRHYPLPKVRDTDGDGQPELLLLHPDRGWREFYLAQNSGNGQFSPALQPLGDPDTRNWLEEDPPGAGGNPGESQNRNGSGEDGSEESSENSSDDSSDAEDSFEIVLFDDIDGDGRAEFLAQRQIDQESEGMRQELAEAKRPNFAYRVHQQGADKTPATEPSLEFSAEGYAFDGGDEVALPGGFQDLDGDGDQDLVTITLDFSLLQAVKILATRQIGIGLDFHIWCQEGSGGLGGLGGSGSFRRVSGLDLSGKFNLDLNHLRIQQLSQFKGDFDGDGRQDFLQMGRGKKISIHRGREGCAYPPSPDLTLTLEEPPRDLSLVQVRDLDADSLSDLLVIHPLETSNPGVTSPVRLDLYLSGGGK
ncbi:MAG: VCBS repeat-containing protein [Deltaproteobacteria bacterium]|nr:VCBS repeat-containing protein [Deltaproteobacteria bacterium]